MRVPLLLAVLALAGCAHSPYAGQQQRQIKALSDAQIASYARGEGMGFAKAAELNGFPGPAHVLEMADELRLSPEQRRATQDLLDAHQAEVRRLGGDYLAAEHDLEVTFRVPNPSPDDVRRITAQIAEIQGRIRASHLTAHLLQARLLTMEQVRRYRELRGY